MNIHVIRSAEVDTTQYWHTLEVLQNTPGPMKFLGDPSEPTFELSEITEAPFDPNKKVFPENRFFHDPNLDVVSKSQKVFAWNPQPPDQVKIVSWDTLFKKCQEFRLKNQILFEDHVVLLTYMVNDLNWFAGSDQAAFNHFVHADQWKLYLPCDPRFPVAYEVAANIFRRLIINSYREAVNHLHKSPKGCLNDFCQQKKDIILKLRTGDICYDCMKHIGERNVPPALLDQVLKIFDSIRTQMLFRERYRNVQRPSRLSVRGNSQRIFFTDLSDVELRLTPLEKTLYLLFLKEENGLMLSDLHDHRNWIREMYRKIGNPRTVAEMENSINQMTDPTENSASEKISKIRRKIIAITGEELAKQYVIDGLVGQIKKIVLDRSLLEWME
ncbi:MAG: hypothetical protein ACKOA1_04055 [Bacteroidota bacterium]